MVISSRLSGHRAAQTWREGATPGHKRLLSTAESHNITDDESRRDLEEGGELDSQEERS